MAKQNKKAVMKKVIPSNLALDEYEKVLPKKDYINIADIKIENNFETYAGQRFEAAKIWIPKILFFCKVCCGLSILSFLILLITFINKPSPTLLVNYESGSLACSNSPINPTTKKILSREEGKYQYICDSLGNFDSEYGD